MSQLERKRQTNQDINEINGDTNSINLKQKMIKLEIDTKFGSNSDETVKLPKIKGFKGKLVNNNIRKSFKNRALNSISTNTSESVKNILPNLLLKFTNSDRKSITPNANANKGE